jgi:hypothetical protein
VLFCKRRIDVDGMCAKLDRRILRGGLSMSRLIAPCLAAFVAIASPAAAGWLERAASDDMIDANGMLAVTLGDAGILLVVPEAVIQEAQAAGVAAPDAARLLVQRYGQRCSDVLDLDRPHAHLRVQLFLQRPVALEDAPERVQGEILDALKTAKTKPLPRVNSLFVTAEEGAEIFIDYVPDRKARCIQPGDEVS